MGEIDIVSILVDLIFTAAMYMLGPLEIVLTQKTDFTKKEARKVAIINSIVVYFLFLFIFIFVRNDGSVPKGTPSLFYGFINYWLLSKKLNAEEQKEDTKDKE